MTICGGTMYHQRGNSIGVGAFDHVYRHYSYKELQRIPREDQMRDAQKFLDQKRETNRKLQHGKVIYLHYNTTARDRRVTNNNLFSTKEEAEANSRALSCQDWRNVQYHEIEVEVPADAS